MTNKIYFNFLRLWRRFFLIFEQAEKKTEIEVAEKVEAFRSQSIRMAGDLKQACKELRGKVTEHEYNLVNSLVKPLIRRVQHLPHKASGLTDEMQLTDLVAQSKTLAISAHKWVDLCTRIKHREEIIQEAIRAAANHSLTLIDRDLKLIEEYRRWRNDEVGSFARDKSSLRQKLQRQLLQQISQLQKLKDMPELSFEELAHWRQKIDRLRNRYVNSALKVIDRLSATP